MRHWLHTVSSRISQRHCLCALKRVGNWNFSKQILIQNWRIIGDPGVGKTTIILDMLANMQNHYPKARILFISAEMNEIDLTVYVERYPKFQTLPILFVETDFGNEIHNWEVVKEVVEQGWDIVAIDSFYELQGIIKDEENIRMKDAESWLLQLIKKQNKA